MNVKERKRFLVPWLLAVLAVIGFAAVSSAEPERIAEPYDRVIIFGMDDVGGLPETVSMPNFRRIFAGGRITYTAQSTVTISAPGWGAMFYGVDAMDHATANIDAEARHKSNELYTSFFKVVKDAYPEEKVASFANWTAINWGLIDWDCGVDIVPGGSRGISTDEMETKLLEYLETEKPKLLFVYYDEPDAAVHRFGWASKEHLDTIEAIDAKIGRLYDELGKKGLLENALVIFATDHGAQGIKHGGNSPAERNCTFAVTGPRLETEGAVGEMDLQDVAAVVLYALDVEKPESMTARVPAGIFPGVGGETRKQSPVPELVDRYGKYGGAAVPQAQLSRELQDKLVYYQNFDGEKVRGLAGKRELAEGPVGKALILDRSYLKTNVKSSTKWSGMTVGFWFRDESSKAADRKSTDAVFVTDKNWKKGANKGFAIAKLNQPVGKDYPYPFEDRIQINVGDGKKFRKDILWALPKGYERKWIHCLAVFDPETREVRLYIDFALAGKAQMLPERHRDWVTGKGIMAGQDVTGKYSDWGEGRMDELMIFSQALTEEDVAALRDAYDRAFAAAEQE